MPTLSATVSRGTHSDPVQAQDQKDKAGGVGGSGGTVEVELIPVYSVVISSWSRPQADRFEVGDD